MDDATDGEDVMEAAGKALAVFEQANGLDVWKALGVEREDVLQETAMRAWNAVDRYDGTTPIGAWLYINAEYGLKDYVRGLQQDQKKRSATRVVLAGLDDEPVVWKSRTESLDDEDFHDEPAAAEVSGQSVDRGDEIKSLRILLDTAFSACLTGKERRAVRIRFGLDGGGERSYRDVGQALGCSHESARVIVDSALTKLRAEFRASEIVNL